MYIPYSRTQQALQNLGQTFRERAAMQAAGAEREAQHKLSLAGLELQAQKAAGENKLSLIDARYKRQQADIASEAQKRDDEYLAAMLKESEKRTENEAYMNEMTTPLDEVWIAGRKNKLTDEQIQPESDALEKAMGPYARQRVPRKDIRTIYQNLADLGIAQLREKEKAGVAEAKSTAKAAVDAKKDYEKAFGKRSDLKKELAIVEHVIKNPKEFDDFAKGGNTFILGGIGAKYDPAKAAEYKAALEDELYNVERTIQSYEIQAARERINSTPPPTAEEIARGDTVRQDRETGYLFDWDSSNGIWRRVERDTTGEDFMRKVSDLKRSIIPTAR